MCDRCTVGKDYGFRPGRTWMDSRGYVKHDDATISFRSLSVQDWNEYCWRSPFLLQFSDYGIEGVVPSELLPPEVNAKFSSKPAEKVKRTRKEDSKSVSAHQPREHQVHGPPSTCRP